MSLLGQFAPAVGAMMAQSKRMEVIGLNIANMNTGGYKRSETSFTTLLAQTYDHNRDIGGVRAYTRSMISQQGNILASDSNYDVAISGGGFFMLNSEIDGSGTQFYGRDGMFQQALGNETTTLINGANVTTREGYLVDKNGYFVQGWPINSDGETFPTDEGSLQSLRIDPAAFTLEGEATSAATLALNLPSDASINYSESTFIKAYDANGDLQSYQLKFTNIVLGTQTSTATPAWDLPSLDATGTERTQNFTIYDQKGFPQDIKLTWTKTANPDEWKIQVAEDGTNLDIDGTDDNVFNDVLVTFDGVSGAIVSPTSLNIATKATDGATFTLDLASMTQTIGGSTFTSSSTTVNGTKADKLDNQWTLDVYDSDGNAITPSRSVLEFDGSGGITTPSSVTVTDSNGLSFELDVSNFTNYSSGQIYEVSYDFNGHSDATMTSFHFNADGEIIGRFSDASQRPIYKLPLATFTNPDALDPVNGNVYKYDPNAGDLVVRTANGQGAGVFVANAREISNVSLEDEFSKMIITQNAYNTASTVIKTVDEMTEVARDLKA